MFGLEKLYSTRNLYIVRLDYIGEDRNLRYIFRGPFVKGGLKYFEMLPSKKKIYVYFYDKELVKFEDFIHFRDLFSDLKWVTLDQIDNITKRLHKGDEISHSVVNSKLELKL